MAFMKVLPRAAGRSARLRIRMRAPPIRHAGALPMDKDQ